MHSTDGSTSSVAADTSQADRGVQRLSIPQALELAIQLHRAGRLPEAGDLYRSILEMDPREANALNFLAMVTLEAGDGKGAIELMERSIAIAPTADRYNNLGNLLLCGSSVEQAVAAYERAIELAPDHANAYSNLGIIFKARRQFEAALRAYERALELNADHVEAHTNYGNLLVELGRVREAMRHYAKAILLRPFSSRLRWHLAQAHYHLGDVDAAVAIYRDWLSHTPDDPEALHLLAGCTGENVPVRCSDAYIESEFDSFSGTFDAHLAKLQYCAPELVCNALAAAAGPPRKALSVLDAGCGTGLCGELVAPYAARLEGVDLSAGMLAKAARRSVYHQLVKAELTGYLQAQDARYDAIVSADTLVYFGELSAVARAAYGALRAPGLLILTVESAKIEDAPGGYRLNHHGRYAHTGEYIERTLHEAGFDVTIATATLRLERLEAVEGLVVIARKKPAT